MKILGLIFRYTAMKPLLFISLFYLISCHPNDSANHDTSTKELSETIVKPRPWSYTRNWRCSEGQFKCTMKLHSAEGVDTVIYAEAMVRRETDTVLSKRVSINTLQFLMNRFAKSSQHEVVDITGYCMADIIPMSGIRDYNTFYVSRLTHPNKANLYLSFAIKMFHTKHPGKVWHFGCSRDSSRYAKAKKECTFQEFEI